MSNKKDDPKDALVAPDPNYCPSVKQIAEGINKTQAEIWAIIEKAPKWTKQIKQSSNPVSQNVVPLYTLNYSNRPSPWNIIVHADSTPTKAKKFAITDWLPERKLTLLIGPPGAGKTTIALALGAAISQGRDFNLWDGTTANGFGNVIISSTEDDYADTLKPRFIGAGGNLRRFMELGGIPASHPSISYYTRACNFSDSDNAIWLNEAKKLGNIGLLIFDPATQVIRGDTRNGSKARGGYENYGQFAEVLDCAVLGIGHTTKSTKGKGTFDRIEGSGEAAKVARGIIIVTKIKGGPMASGATHIMVLAKPFDKPVLYGVTYSIKTVVVTAEKGEEFETSKVVWHDLIQGTPEELLLQAESGELAGAGKVDPLDAAASFLNETLKAGPVPVGEIKRLAKASGITTRDLAQAKKTIGVIHFKQKGAGQSSQWLWRLP